MSFGEVCQLVKGISYSSDQYADSDGGVPFITIKCVSKSGGFKAEGIKYYKGPIRPHELIQTDDLLIANTDLTRAGDIVGCPVRLPDLASPRITMSMDLSKVKVNPSVADPGFIYYKLMERPARSFMRENSSGSTVLHLKTSAVPRLPVQIPVNIAEQRQIAEVLDTLDTAIHETEAIIAKLKSVKQGLLHDLLTRGIDANGELRPPQAEAPNLYKQSVLGWIPKEWVASSVEAEFVVDSGITLGQHRLPRQKPRPYLRVANVHRAKLKLTDIAFLEASDSEAEKKSLQPGDLLVVEGHASTEEIGRCAIADQAVTGYLFQNHLFRLRPKSLCNTFALLWMNSRFVRNYWKTEAATSSGLNTINKTKLNVLGVAVPKIEEQELIAVTAETIDARIFGEETILKKFQQEKSGLMDDLLTGRVRVTPLLEGTP